MICPNNLLVKVRESDKKGFVTYRELDQIKSPNIFESFSGSEHIEMQNDFISGFRMSGRVGGGGGGYDERMAWICLQDPRGFEVEVELSDFLSFIVNRCTLEKGVIKEKLKYVYVGKRIKLINESTFKKNTAEISIPFEHKTENVVKIKKKDLVVGQGYKLKNGNKVVYVGEYFILEDVPYLHYKADQYNETLSLVEEKKKLIFIENNNVKADELDDDEIEELKEYEADNTFDGTIEQYIKNQKHFPTFNYKGNVREYTTVPEMYFTCESFLDDEHLKFYIDFYEKHQKYKDFTTSDIKIKRIKKVEVSNIEDLLNTQFLLFNEYNSRRICSTEDGLEKILCNFSRFDIEKGKTTASEEIKRVLNKLNLEIIELTIGEHTCKSEELEHYYYSISTDPKRKIKTLVNGLKSLLN